MNLEIKMGSLYICVKNMQRAVQFYETFLGQKADTVDPVFSVFDIRGFRYCLFYPDKVNESVTWGDSCLPSFEVNDIDLAFQKVTGMGCPVVFPLKQIGTNMVFECTDSEGNDIELFCKAK